MAEKDLLIGVDVGTTSVKAALFDTQGRALAQFSRRYPTQRMGGLVEQDPREWTSGIDAAMEALLTDPTRERVAAVGLCSQVNTDVFVDAQGRALAPAIMWQDNRAAAEAADIAATVTDAEFKDWFGAPLPIGASHVLARMAWMSRHRPAIFEATRYVLSPKDYCLLALANVAVSDPMTNFFIVGKDLTYLKPLLARVDGAEARLAPLRAFTEIVGEIALGASGKRAPVVAGTMDAWSGLIGAGVHKAGQGVYMSGASEILAATSASRGGAPGIVSFPQAMGMNVHAGPTQSGGDSLRWWGETQGTDVAGVLTLANQADRTRRPILFLPHLEGERAPLWDTQLRGAFVGIDGAAAGPDFALAILEGVALSARMLLGSVDAAAGEPPARWSHAGGGARSDLWAQIRADCLGRPLDRVRHPDVGCLGAAIMAGIGVGVFKHLSEGVAAMTSVERSFEPDPRYRARYDALYHSYTRAIDALRPIGQISYEAGA